MLDILPRELQIHIAKVVFDDIDIRIKTGFVGNVWTHPRSIFHRLNKNLYQVYVVPAAIMKEHAM